MRLLHAGAGARGDRTPRVTATSLARRDLARDERQFVSLRNVPEDSRSTRSARARRRMSARKPARFATTKVEVEGREETKIVELPSLEPEPWTAPGMSIVGCETPRVDAPAKLSGRARYPADEHPAGMLQAVILRSSIPKGRIVRLDLSRALASPGVRSVLTRDDVP